MRCGSGASTLPRARRPSSSRRTTRTTCATGESAAARRRDDAGGSKALTGGPSFPPLRSYGKEGKRADYTPYSCLKIISNNPGTGDHHGCPFKTFGEQSLAAALKELKVSPQDQRAILAKAQGHHYQLACQGCFTATHGGQEPAEGVRPPPHSSSLPPATDTTLSPAAWQVNHPNEYFTQSRQLAAARKAAALPGPAAADLQAGLEPKTPAAARATPMEH